MPHSKIGMKLKVKRSKRFSWPNFTYCCRLVVLQNSLLLIFIYSLIYTEVQNRTAQWERSNEMTPGTEHRVVLWFNQQNEKQRWLSDTTLLFSGIFVGSIFVVMQLVDREIISHNHQKYGILRFVYCCQCSYVAITMALYLFYTVWIHCVSIVTTNCFAFKYIQ